jgi:hypothetical protein
MYAVTVETAWPERGAPIYLVTFENLRPVGARHSSRKKLLWKPRDAGRQSTPIYLVASENARPKQERHTSCKQLLWKPHDPSNEHAHIYLVTFETSQPVGARNSSCNQLLWKPCDVGGLGTPIYLVTFENLRPVGVRNTSCTQLLRKPHDPGRQGTPISIVTTETSQCGQARHTHLRSYRGNLNNVHASILYCSISAQRTFMYLTWTPQLVMSLTYHPHVRQTKFYVLSLPAILWQSVKLLCRSVTETDNATMYIR